MREKITNPGRRRPVNLTIREDIIREAKSLKINTSREAEKGVEAAIKKAKEEQWLKNNAKAIKAYNKFIHKNGDAIESFWMKDHGTL